VAVFESDLRHFVGTGINEYEFGQHSRQR
jgi:hypothetical protein